MNYLIKIKVAHRANKESLVKGFSKTIHTKMMSCLYFSQSSSTELLQKVCEVVGWGLEALSKGVITLLPQDGSAITDSAFMQVCGFQQTHK